MSGKAIRVGGVSGTRFSLWVLVLARTNPHRLKRVPLEPSETACFLAKVGKIL